MLLYILRARLVHARLLTLKHVETHEEYQQPAGNTKGVQGDTEEFSYNFV